METTGPAARHRGLTKDGKSRIFRDCIFFVLTMVFFFAAAGSLDVPRGWVFFSLSLVYFLINGIVIVRKNPEIVNQRGQIRPGTKAWDRILIAAYVSALVFLILIAGLDAGRFRWSGEAIGVRYSIAAAVVYVAAMMLIQWAMLVNPFFEPSVRIQKERGHRVVASGPYRIVRHPGYLGVILAVISMPLILGSVVSFIPAGFVILLFIIRTVLEDRTLKGELDGYREYAARVKYRMFPGIW